ncbi:MAG: biotin/lipoyl-containing protein [Sporomusaceae bacterium]|nr:biotin/lipoyl-containing protein [Sporomusaceae bacterium]
MKNYSITVNGQTYEVAVEEIGGVAAPAAPKAAAPVAAPKAAPAPVAAAPAPAPKAAPKAGGPGTKVASPMPGKIISVKVNVGDAVKNGQELIVMEAMKMHNPVLSSADGVVKEILVKAGDPVQAGTPLVVVG